MAERPLDGAFEPSRELVRFVCTALHYAAAPNGADEARLLDSPFSRVAHDDARAIGVAARGRELPSETIEAQRVPLTHDSFLAARRFVAALAAVVRAFRTQGSGARDVVAAICHAFALDEQATAGEARTLAEIVALTGALDEVHGVASAAWDPAGVIAALRAAPALRRPYAAAAPARVTALGPFEREPTTNVPRQRGHQSASSLGAFAECERKWYYRYVCAAVEDRGSSASAYGSAFHLALEHFHEEYPRGDAAPPELLASKLDARIIDAFEHYRRGFETNVEFELQKRRARRTAKRYLAWFLERSRAHPFTVIGREAAAEIELDGYRFIGYIDRLDRDDATGGVTVVDYKTGTIAESAAEYRERIARFVDFQLPFYYWARTLEGDRVTRLALVPLKESQLDVRPIELEVVPVPAAATRDRAATGTIGIDELQRARARMIELARALADEDIRAFAVTTDPNACRYCAYANACRDRPSQSEDRFGR